MAQQPWYATREDVRSALGSASSARSDAQVDRALADATADIDKLCHRVFAPVLAARFFDWPSEQTPRSWRLWLDQNDLIAATLITSAGATIPDTDYYLEPANSGPPYTHVVTRLDRPSLWEAGDTWQHAIGVTGWWGYGDDQVPAGVLVGGIDTATTAAQVTDSSVIGVGNLLTLGAERAVVTGRTMADTAVTLADPITAKKDATVLTMSGPGVCPNEVITIDGERLRVETVMGSTLVVERAVDGTVLAAHDAGTAVWAPRGLVLARGAAGTTAVPAADGIALTRWAPPGPVWAYAVGHAQQGCLQEQAGYARTVRSQAGTGTRSVAAVTGALDGLRQRVEDGYARKARTRAV